MWLNRKREAPLIKCLADFQLIDFIIQTHPAYSKVQAMAEEKKSNVFDVLEAKLEELKKERGCDTSSMFSLRESVDPHRLTG